MDRDTLLNRALSLADEGDWVGVAELLREYLSEFEEDPAVHCWLGVAEQELGFGGMAYERFKRALSLNPQDPYILATAGNGIAYFDDPDAEQALRAAAVMAPHVAIGRMMYGAYLAREGFLETAVQELSAAWEIAPDDPQVAYELGVAYALSEDHDRAIDALADAVRLDLEDGWVRVVFGLVLLEAERTEEALGELLAGAALREEDIDAQLVGALAAAATGRDGTAMEMLERARIRAAEDDVVLITAVEDRVDAGAEWAQALLVEELAPDMLHTRLRERP